MLPFPFDFAPVLTGFLTAIGLIVAIGAQNAWVLNKCLHNENPRAIIAVCITIDSVLIFTGVFFMNHVQEKLPLLTPVFTWLAVGILLWMSLHAMQRIWHSSGGSLVASGDVQRGSPWQAAGQAMLISLLNPHVYLDTVVLIGSVGSQQSSPVLFAVGASFASFMWFSSLALGAKQLRKTLSSPAHWRVFDGITAAIMLYIATTLAIQASGLFSA
ncbi:LysE/ArgO family amino acid transporter [Thalassolituus sp. LLYu03]|uniref:LysE/ArgO family amino acid transporter n=1 Tax=Thalassolituus sp. LLYu03 TaxID=3421656 RepID=UPI003D2C1891